MAECVSRGDCSARGVGLGDAGAGGTPPGGATGPAAGSGGMAVSVTRHAEISGEGQWRVLAWAVDSLDVSLHIDWGEHWERLLEAFEKGKGQAAGTKGIPFDIGSKWACIILPSGKRPSYRYCLQTSAFHLWLGVAKKASDHANGYSSLSSLTVRTLGVEGAVGLVTKLISLLGGTVRKVKPSRCDMAVDLHIPGGLTSTFLEKYGVSRSDKRSFHKDRRQLETFYVGDKGAAVLLRIYDKAREIKVSGKTYLRGEWGYDGPDVWRIEYQLRRPVLKEFKIQRVNDLPKKLGGVWKYLTRISHQRSCKRPSGMV